MMQISYPYIGYNPYIGYKNYIDPRVRYSIITTSWVVVLS